MKKIFAAVAVATIGLCAPATAHPTDIPYDSFGQCQAALSQFNKIDRDMFAEFFPNYGAATVDMIDSWWCEYDSGAGAWYIEGAPGVGGNLGNGNGKADPGTAGD